MKAQLLSFSFEDSSPSDSELSSSPTGSGMTTLLRYVTCQSITWQLAKTYHKKRSWNSRPSFSRTDSTIVGKGCHTAEVAGKGLMRGTVSFLQGWLRPIDADCGQGGGGQKESQNDNKGWLEWLTKGSMMPMRAAILSCTLASMNSESERALPIVKLRKRSS